MVMLNKKTEVRRKLHCPAKTTVFSYNMYYVGITKYTYSKYIFGIIMLGY
jgi:hypothetical protein